MHSLRDDEHVGVRDRMTHQFSLLNPPSDPRGHIVQTRPQYTIINGHDSFFNAFFLFSLAARVITSLICLPLFI